MSRKRLPIAYTARESWLSSRRLVPCFRRFELRDDILREKSAGQSQRELWSGWRGGLRRLIALDVELVSVRYCFLLLRLGAKLRQAFDQSRNFALRIIDFSQREQQVVDSDLVAGICAEHEAALFNGLFVLPGLQIKIAEHVAREREIRLYCDGAGRRLHSFVEFRAAHRGPALRNNLGLQIVEEGIAGMRFQFRLHGLQSLVQIAGLQLR